MEFAASVNAQVALLEAGKVLEALDRFLAEDGVMYSNGVLFGEGHLRCRQMQEPFLAAAANIHADISDVGIDEAKGFCVFRNRTRFDGPDGVQRQINGLHVQQWCDGKIACEWYFNGEPMAETLESGILANPALILDLIG